MKRFLLSLAIGAYLVSCSSTPSPKVKPNWVDNKYNQYPESEYLVEIGVGSSLKNAKRDGVATLAQIFKTSIKVETTIQTRYRELSEAGSVQASEETDFDQNIVQMADQEMINVNYGESWTNQLGQVHIVTYINRLKTGNIYRDRINDNNDTINNFINNSKEQNSLIRTYAYFDAAYVVAQANRVLKEQLEIINRPMSRSTRQVFDFDNLRSDRMDAALEMAFRLNIENDLDGKVSAVIADQLTSFGFSINPKGILSVSGQIQFDKLELENKYKNIKYYLTLTVEDENGVPIVAIEANDRISAMSESDAKNRAFLDIEKIVKRKMIGELQEYFDSFVN